MSICNALLKYGYENFEIYILETFDTNISKIDLILAEHK
jgi:hypothetical protein